MSQLAGSPNVDAASQAASLAPHILPPTRPGTSCLRCGGLLVHSYTASLERDISGSLVMLWRCINCGNCTDGFILANQWKGPGPAGPRVRVPRGPQQTKRPRPVSVNGSSTGVQTEG